MGNLKNRDHWEKNRGRKDNNIKKDLQDVGMMWNGLIWLKEETHGRLL